MSVCRRCIMPDSYPSLTVDRDGICSLCRIHDASPRLKRPVAGKDALLQVLTSKAAGQHDCVVPLSGGKDSSYALYYVATELGLKPLAVFADNGFVTDSAKENIERICEKLSVDLVVHKARFRRRLTREALYIWKHRGSHFSACPPCETNNRSVAIAEATKRGIPFIVWGASDFEDDAVTFQNPDARTFRERSARKRYPPGLTPLQIGKRLFVDSGLRILYETITLSIPWDRKVKAASHVLRYIYYAIRNNLDVGVPEGWRRYLALVQVSFEGRSVETVYLFDYIPYDPYAFVSTLKQELGWGAPDAKEARMDCRLHSLAAYQHFKETGITLDGFTFSVLIRYGLMTRAEAERKEEAIRGDLIEHCEGLLEELGIDKEGMVP